MNIATGKSLCTGVVVELVHYRSKPLYTAVVCQEKITARKWDPAVNRYTVVQRYF